MNKHLLVVYLFSWLFYLPLAGQTPKEDILIGTFTNSQNGLLLSVKPVTSNTYEGFLEYQGKRYPFSGSRLLGMLSGEYAYERAQVSFTLARILGIYYFTSEGISLEMARTTSTPVNTAPAETINPPSNPPPAATAPQGPVPTNAPVATGPRINDPYGSFNFQLPAGWSHSMPEGLNILLTNPNFKAQISIVPHHYPSLAEIRENTTDLEDEESNTALKAVVRDYGNRGLFVRYDGIAQGQATIIETITMVSPYGVGVSVVGTAFQPDYSQEFGNAIKSVANSVQFTKTADPPIVQQWKQQLTNKQLLYLYTGNGLSDKITIDLCKNGSFEYYSDSSYMSGGYSQLSYAGSNSKSGNWRIISKNTSPVLLLFFSGGSIHQYTLAPRETGGGIALNGRRYFVQDASTCE